MIGLNLIYPIINRSVYVKPPGFRIKTKNDAGTTAVFNAVENKNVLKTISFFMNSFDHSYEKTKKLDLYDVILSKILVLFYKLHYSPKTDVVEEIRLNDKILGCYAIRLPKNGDSAEINFLAVAPEIKDTKQSLRTLYDMGMRIVEHVLDNNKRFLQWEADKDNYGAFQLYQRFPAKKKNFKRRVTYTINIADFYDTLLKLSKSSDRI